MRFLVTGGAGFIGAHLVENLVIEGHDSVILDDLSTGREGALPAGVTLVRGCVTDSALVAKLTMGVDGVFHLAAIASVARSNDEWMWTHRVNQGGTVAVMDAASIYGVPVVYASSAAVYGAQDHLPLSENLPPQPLTAYGVDKFGSELHARVAANIHGMATVGLRFFNVYGPGQQPDSPYSGVVSIFMDRITRGRPLDLHGGGVQSRDFIFVADVVEALRAAMRCFQGKSRQSVVLNVCTGRSTSIAGLARLMMTAAGRSVSIRELPLRTGDIAASLGDPALATSFLGFTAKTDVATGLRLLLETNPTHKPKVTTKAAR